jgi:hypothetical protein
VTKKSFIKFVPQLTNVGVGAVFELAVDAGRRLRRREVRPVGGDGGVGVAPVRNYNQCLFTHGYRRLQQQHHARLT